MLNKNIKFVQFGQAAQIVKAQDKQGKEVPVTDALWPQIDQSIQKIHDATGQPLFLVPAKFHKIPEIKNPVLLRDQLPNDLQATKFVERKLIPLSTSRWYPLLPQKLRETWMICLIADEARQSHRQQSLLTRKPLIVTVTPEKPHDPKL